MTPICAIYNATWYCQVMSILITLATYMRVCLSATEKYRYLKKKKKKKKAPDLLVLLVEHLLDHHTGEELETGYFL